MRGELDGVQSTYLLRMAHIPTMDSIHTYWESIGLDIHQAMTEHLLMPQLDTPNITKQSWTEILYSDSTKREVEKGSSFSHKQMKT